MLCFLINLIESIFWYKGATAEYPATIVPDCTCAHIFKERDMCRNKLTQVAGYSAVKLIEQKRMKSYKTQIKFIINIRY